MLTAPRLSTDSKPFAAYIAACAMVASGALFAASAQAFTALGIEIDSGAMRAALLSAMGMIGLLASAKAGLQLWPKDWVRVWRVGLLYAAATAIIIIVLDCIVFRRDLSPEYVSFLRKPLSIRLVYFSIRAFMENTVYHLFALSLLVLLFGGIWRKPNGSPSDGAYWAAIVLSQVINIAWTVILRDPITPLTLSYDTIRYIAPGCLWGYLFWRYGFVTAEIAHVLTHFFLQPAFSIFFR